jgi:hypothetical protein
VATPSYLLKHRNDVSMMLLAAPIRRTAQRYHNLIDIHAKAEIANYGRLLMLNCQGLDRLPPLDEALAEGQAGQVSAAAAAGFVPDAVQV